MGGKQNREITGIFQEMIEKNTTEEKETRPAQKARGRSWGNLPLEERGKFLDDNIFKKEGVRRPPRGQPI